MHSACLEPSYCPALPRSISHRPSLGGGGAAGLPWASLPLAAGETGQSPPLLSSKRAGACSLHWTWCSQRGYCSLTGVLQQVEVQKVIFFFKLLVETHNPSSQFLALLLSLLGWSRFNCLQQEGLQGVCSSNCASIIVCTKARLCNCNVFCILSRNGLRYLESKFFGKLDDSVLMLKLAG